jgi:hypothetical protein
MELLEVKEMSTLGKITDSIPRTVPLIPKIINLEDVPNDITFDKFCSGCGAKYLVIKFKEPVNKKSVYLVDTDWEIDPVSDSTLMVNLCTDILNRGYDNLCINTKTKTISFQKFFLQ